MTLVSIATEFINNTNGIVTSPPPLKIGDFGDQDDQARNLSLYKRNFELNTCPGLNLGNFGD